MIQRIRQWFDNRIKVKLLKKDVLSLRNELNENQTKHQKKYADQETEMEDMIKKIKETQKAFKTLSEPEQLRYNEICDAFAYANTTKDKKTPILDGCAKNDIDTTAIENFLVKYGEFLRLMVAKEAFDLHRSNKFPMIINTTEALNQGQQCLSSFMRRFFNELQYKRDKQTVEQSNQEESEEAFKDAGL